MDMITTQKSIEASFPEDLFVDIFSEAFGIEKVQYLMHEYPFIDINGMGRYIDYAIQTEKSKYAIEIDGIYYHSDPENFENDLIKQNSLIYKNWKVFRWTDRQLYQSKENVKEELITFFEEDPKFKISDDYLPLKKTKVIYPKPHQEETLEYLNKIRQEGASIALIPHATGAGKTITAILDAKTLNLPTLYVAHRQNLVEQVFKQFLNYWQEKRIGKFTSTHKDVESFVITATVQSIEKNLELFKPDQFGYIIIDEAHHAVAGTYINILKYFKPKFILGLTGTDERYDGKSLIEIFQNNAPRLSLEEAIKIGELCPIRCVRVKTNVDLRNVRYNGVNYNIKDLEQKLFIPERDNLILQTYLEHVPGLKTVIFTVSVKHSEFLENLFNEAKIPARSVSGRMSLKERENILSLFSRGDIRVLMACDVLNEGWDCPDIEVLIMARPTLSKVIYLQQLGRGTRKAPDKESLKVFDFVDNTTMFNQSLNLHRLFNVPRYFPGALVAAPDKMIKREQEILNRGEKPEALVNLHLWIKDMEAVDLFNWQEEVRQMLTSNQLAIELGVSSETVLNWIKAEKVKPDYVIPMGMRTYHYFKKEQIEKIRKNLNLKKRTAETIKDDFFEFINEMDMTASYKPVLLLAMIELADEKGKVNISKMVQFFRNFYMKRKEGSQVIEKTNMAINKVETMSDCEIQRIIFIYPFEKFERKRFLRIEKDLELIGFNPELWRKLNQEEKAEIRKIALKNIRDYFSKIES